MDDGPRKDMDIGFQGVISRGDPRLMPAGSVRYARNLSFMLGSAATRGGLQTVPWAEEAGVNFPFDFVSGPDAQVTVEFPLSFPATFTDNEAVMSFSVRCGFGPVLGSGVFDDPNGQEALLLAVPRGVYLIRANATPEFLRLPLGLTLDGPVRFVQTFQKVIMFRGTEHEPLEWNPLQSFEDGYEPWLPIGQTDVRNQEADNTFGDGTDQIPNALDAVAFNNRLFVIAGRDEIVVSDILDYTRFSRVRGRWTINAGTSSPLTKLYPFNQTTLLAFKSKSVYIIGNVFGTLASVQVDVLTTEFGCIAPESVLAVGRDVFFLSEAGYFSVTQALDNKLQANAEPLSAPMEEVFNRINWDAARRAVAAYHDNRVFLAVPLDGSRFNNAILTMNLLTRAWEGVWTADFLNVQNFIRLNRAGSRRLFIVNGGEQGADEAGALLLVDSGVEDNLYGAVHQIDCELRSRGYMTDTLGQKDFMRVIFDLETWNPRFSLWVQGDGVNEERLVAQDRERDRRKYMVHGRGLHDVSNVNGDHGAPWREDYSVPLGEDGIHLHDGLDPNKLQRVQYPFRVDRRGEYCQVRLHNAQGRVRLHSITMEARAAARSSQERK